MSVDGEAATFQLGDRGLGDALVVVAEQAIFAGMRRLNKRLAAI